MNLFLICIFCTIFSPAVYGADTQITAVEEPSSTAAAPAILPVAQDTKDDLLSGPVSKAPLSLEDELLPIMPHVPLTLVPTDQEQSAATLATPPALLDTMVYLGNYVEPWRYASDEKLEFIFDNAELSTFISYIAEKFNITFLLDDNVKPLPQGGKSLVGTKISFKTHVPLSKKEAWNLFVTFLDMAGVAAVPGPGERVYRITTSKDPKQPNDAIRGPLPMFIGIAPSLIPDNDTLIRYVYFVTHINLDAVVTTIDVLKSPAAPHAVRIPELNAVIITDRAVNIKTLLAVIHELDQANAQEGLAVIKLEHADAVKAAQLYADFAKQDTTQGMAARLLGSRKTPTNEYFSRGARVIPEPRRNLLIVLGTREAIEVITEFVRTIVERQDDRPEAPRYIVPLKHLDAENLASILTEALKFKEESDASRSGGVRDGDKYIKSISIVPEPTNNNLIITADYEDFSKLEALIKSIDIEQPQVALRLFVISITNTNNTGFGVQMRNKIPGPNGLLGDNINFQTTNLAEVGSGLVENNLGGGAARLLGNILNIASAAPIGSTIVSLGSDAFGAWGVLNMLQQYTKAEVVANPFLVTTNKFPAQFKLGEIRRVADATVLTTVSATAFTDIPAVLNISITPQISLDGLVSLDVYFDLEQFTDANVNSSNGNRSVSKIETSVIVADNEVLALGGLIRTSVTEAETKIPVLGDIPLLGWLFKNRTRTITDTSLLLLVQAEVIHPIANNQSSHLLTEQQAHDSRVLAEAYHLAHGVQDPFNRLLFKDREKPEEEFINRFIAAENRYTMQAVTNRTSQQHNAQHNQSKEACRDKNTPLRSSRDVLRKRCVPHKRTDLPAKESTKGSTKGVQAQVQDDADILSLISSDEESKK